MEDNQPGQDVINLIHRESKTPRSPLAWDQFKLGPTASIKGLFLRQWASVCPPGSIRKIIQATFSVVIKCLTLRNSLQAFHDAAKESTWKYYQSIQTLEDIYSKEETAAPDI
jgi:hypothetical protein